MQITSTPRPTQLRELKAWMELQFYQMNMAITKNTEAVNHLRNLLQKKKSKKVKLLQLLFVRKSKYVDACEICR